MKTVYKKRIRTTILTILTLFILLYNIPFNINKKIKAIEIKLDDPNYMEKRTINIVGKYHFNLFISDIFRGRINAFEYGPTTEELRDFKFREYSCCLNYKYKTSIRPGGCYNYDITPLGSLYAMPLMKKTVIRIRDYNENGKRGGWPLGNYFLVANANNREEALKILEKYKISTN
ncbi:hypothetical protein IMX26_14220 [Clostridium sp. 'deep sea']|uniref:hypothetical protein n=1 Tax=Clostridium sp. 'deep sea' TaxID=2779445 RepID=UPI001896A0F5|nr:hypothetical protein [Clostridium sp. 'deep sea']QOR34615.1 hypothetical protein IMX26_14220 [Clostridium sp. 'deep sea']